MSITAAPRWDLSPWFPSMDSPEYRAFKEELAADLEGLRLRAEQLPPLTEESEAGWVALLLDLEGAEARTSHLGSYLGCLTSADSADEQAARDKAALATLAAAREKVVIRAREGLRAAPEEAFARLLARPELAGAGHHLRRLRERARWSMDPACEALASDLAVDGLSAWGRLYDRLAGRLTFSMPGLDDAPARVPMALKRSLTESPDPGTRRAAQEASNQAWGEVEHVAAAALNALAGTRLTLQRWRGVEDFLAPALFDAGISARTLAAMLEAIEARREIPRAYLRRKAALLGQPRLAFHDLSAPLPLADPRPFDWGRARETVLRSFAAFDPELEGFARRAFEERWIDAEVRPSKVPGGFCTSSPLARQSRIFMTYNDTLGDLRTLAHELGHGFHNHVMGGLRPWARRYPMTLAETASTFAEAVLTEALLDDPATHPQDRAVLLDGLMEHAAVYLLNIPMRYLFEKRFHEARIEGEVPVSRLKELMLAAQSECYGDVLDPAGRDPLFWASKLHFYLSGIAFYNFPYAFGYLFSLGVFARARQEGPGFLPRYRDLLRATGQGTAEEVARRALGVDLESGDFWHASLDRIAEDLKRWEAVVPAAVEAGGGGPRTSPPK